MKILVLDGISESNRISTDILESFRVISEHSSFELEVVHLKEHKISYCRGCFGCWVKTPGECVIDDDARNICAKIINSDIVIYLTPIVFGAYSPTLKVLLDRSIPLIHPFFKKIQGEYHHQKRYNKYPSIFTSLCGIPLKNL
ncbi:MAG: flavodoxin family protein [Candidatus Thorarchaeota archaeon]